MLRGMFRNVTFLKEPAKLGYGQCVVIWWGDRVLISRVYLFPHPGSHLACGLTQAPVSSRKQNTSCMCSELVGVYGAGHW